MGPVAYSRGFCTSQSFVFGFEATEMNLREVIKQYGRNAGSNIDSVCLYAKQLFQSFGWRVIGRVLVAVVMLYVQMQASILYTYQCLCEKHPHMYILCMSVCMYLCISMRVYVCA